MPVPKMPPPEAEAVLRVTIEELRFSGRSFQMPPPLTAALRVTVEFVSAAPVPTGETAKNSPPPLVALLFRTAESMMEAASGLPSSPPT